MPQMILSLDSFFFFFFVTKILLLKPFFKVKIFLRCLLILSYLFIFLSKKQKNLVMSIRGACWLMGFTEVLSEVPWPFCCSISVLFSGLVSFSMEEPSCLKDTVLDASVLGVEEGRKLWLSPSNMMISTQSLFSNPCNVSKARNHTSNLNRENFHIKQC